MEYTFEKLEELKKEIMESNLNEKTKNYIISVVSTEFFDRIRTQKEIDDNIEFVRSK